MTPYRIIHARVFAPILLCVALLFVVPASTAPALSEQPDHRFLDDRASIEQVLEIIDQRLALMPAVAAWKWKHRAPIQDVTREEALIARALEQAKALGLSSAGVRRLFELQFRLARESQDRLHTQWHLQGFDPQVRVPDLEQELRPQLDRLSSDLLISLHLASAALSRMSLTPESARAQLPEPRWSEANRRALLAALSAVKRAPSPALERIAASEVLRVGTTGDYAPFTLESQGSLHGADIELAAKLATALKARVSFVRTSWPSLVEDLRADRFDVAMSGISITPAREAEGAFSLPYSVGGKTILARCADAKRFTSLEAVDAPTVRVIVNPGGTNEQFVRAHLRHAQVIVHPDNREIFAEIRAGRADVMITDDVEVDLQTRHHSDLCRAMPGTLTRASKAIFMPRDPKLVVAVNQWLEAALARGEPGDLLRNYTSP